MQPSHEIKISEHVAVSAHSGKFIGRILRYRWTPIHYNFGKNLDDRQRRLL